MSRIEHATATRKGMISQMDSFYSSVGRVVFAITVCASVVSRPDSVSDRIMAADAITDVADRVHALWEQERAAEAEKSLATMADDETFLRRASLDLVGHLPTPDELAAFLLDPAPDKRAELVRRLLDDPRFGANWARYWRDVIMYRRLEDRAMVVSPALEAFLRQQLNNGTSWSAVAEQCITASGDVRENGATALFVAQDGRTEESTAEVARIFLGIQIQCAQCHDHVTDRWTRQQFHELAAFFTRIALRPKKTAEGRSFEVIGNDKPRQRRRPANAARRGSLEHYMPDLEHPDRPGTLMQPVFFLTSEKLPLGASDAQRRATLARWITGNPWFSRAFVNRVWAELIGEGFCEPVDDLGPDHQPQAPQAMEYLAAAFAAADHDIKWLYEVVMATPAYQRAAGVVPSDQTEKQDALASCCWQRLRADQLFDALNAAVGDSGQATPARRRGKAARAYRRSPRFRFGQVFGYDPSGDRQEVGGTIPQALAMMNAPQIDRLIQSRRSAWSAVLDELPDDRAVIEELYLRCLARQPGPAEVRTCMNYVKEVGERREALEDIMWALINSAEFLYRK